MDTRAPAISGGNFVPKKKKEVRSLLICNPADIFPFALELGHMCTCDVLFSSKSKSQMLAFKIQTNAPDRYKVKPMEGFVKPGHLVKIQISIPVPQVQTLWHENFSTMKDCFQLLSAPVDAADFSTEENVKKLSSMWCSARWKKKTSKRKIPCRFYRCASISSDSEEERHVVSKRSSSTQLVKELIVFKESYKTKRPTQLTINNEEPKINESRTPQQNDNVVMPPPSPLGVDNLVSTPDEGTIEVPESPYAKMHPPVQIAQYSISERVAELQSYWDYFLDLLSRLGNVSIDIVEERYLSTTLTWHNSGMLHHAKMKRLRSAVKLAYALEKQEYRLQRVLGMSAVSPSKRKKQTECNPVTPTSARRKKSPRKKVRTDDDEPPKEKSPRRRKSSVEQIALPAKTDRRLEERRRRRSYKEKQLHKKSIDNISKTQRGVMLQWMMRAISRKTSSISVRSPFSKIESECLQLSHNNMLAIQDVLKTYNHLQDLKTLYFEFSQRLKRDELKYRDNFQAANKTLRSIINNGNHTSQESLAYATRVEAQKNLQNLLLAQEAHRKRYQTNFVNKFYPIVSQSVDECLYNAYSAYSEIYSMMEHEEEEEEEVSYVEENYKIGTTMEQQSTELVRALVDSNTATGTNTERELSFYANDCIRVISKDESGWWYGECNGEYGWFPSDFVQQHYDLWSIAELNSPRLNDRASS